MELLVIYSETTGILNWTSERTIQELQETVLEEAFGIPEKKKIRETAATSLRNSHHGQFLNPGGTFGKVL